jgi:hypothetical protein
MPEQAALIEEMQMTSPEDPAYVEAREEARRQARGLRAFYMHALVYLAVMAMLVAINISSGDAWRGNWWVQWPAMTWGMLLVLHGIFANGAISIFGRDWEDRKVEELMRQRKR